MATNQARPQLTYGFGSSAFLGTRTQILNSANAWGAASFVTTEARTLSSVAIYSTAKGGTTANISVTASLCADNAGLPDHASIIETRTIAAGAYAVGWLTFSGFTTELTQGVKYWIIFKNASGTPATDYPTLQISREGSGPFPPASFAAPLTSYWNWVGTINAGTTWGTNPEQNALGMFLGFSDADGSYDGIPASASAAGGAGIGVYAARESGVYFTTPAGFALNVRGVSFPVIKGGTPTGNLRYRLYTGETLTATTSVIPVANATTAFWHTAYFTAMQTLAAGTTYRVVIGESAQSDSSSNYYTPWLHTLKDDANARALLPFGGTLQGTYWDGSAWAETNTNLLPFLLIADTDLPFPAAAASGGGFTGQTRIIAQGVV